MEDVRVQVGEHSYDVHVGEFEAADVLADINQHDPSAIFVISDEHVWRAHGAEFRDVGESFILEPGEKSKTLDTWLDCVRWLAGKKADRGSVVIALGGGMVGDIAGFASAAYMRGIRFVNVATSLLSQVDAAIGGKTAVDLPEGKNLVGAFHHPVAVWCGPRYLKTLPAVQYRSGMAEAIKYGVIMDGAFFEWQSENRQRLKELDASSLQYLVRRCCELKAEIVAQDPCERTGLRSILNFGHTIGHAIEQAMGYQDILHGEAVMAGMILETELGMRLRLVPESLVDRLKDLAAFWELPSRAPDVSLLETMLLAISRDKKAEGGRIAMALPDALGSCRLVRDIDIDVIREVLAA